MTPRGSARPVRIPDATVSAARPDPARGVFTTMLVPHEGPAENVGAHVARLQQSVTELYGRELTSDLEERITAAAAAKPLQRLRVLVGEGGLSVEVETSPLGSDLELEPAVLAPVCLPGGLGAHKWRDRRLLEQLERHLGALPLIVDLDGEVLEAATANVLIVEGATVVTPPLDGRLLPGTMRERVLAVAPSAGLTASEEPITLEGLAAADEVLLSSAIRGVGPATLQGARMPWFEAGARLRHALRPPIPAEVR
ncbi:MAG TPA: aminotransferase class IV [Thermoleophilaceae bacterium]